MYLGFLNGVKHLYQIAVWGEEISPFLLSFEHYIFKRIDYCLNFSLNELAPGCSPKLIMNLIRRGDIPPHYVEWMEYDEAAHRMKSRPSSFYLKCRSAAINCYSLKMLYLARMDITKKWTGRRQDWSIIHAQLAVYFADRMPD